MGAPIRLARETATTTQAGCATLIGLFLTVVGGGILFAMRTLAARGDDNDWIVAVVGGAFALVGIAMLLVGAKLFLVTRLPETIVEVDAMPAQDRRLIHEDNVLDARDILVARDEEATRQGVATIPPTLTLADVEGEKTVVWRLEVWGRVSGWVDFGHPFVIDVEGVRLTDQADG